MNIYRIFVCHIKYLKQIFLITIIHFTNLISITYFDYINLGHSQEDMWRIRKAISEASSLEEVEHLTKLLQAGQIPNKDPKKKSGAQDAGKFTIRTT